MMQDALDRLEKAIADLRKELSGCANGEACVKLALANLRLAELGEAL
jgi:hypothetical protein